MIFFCGCPLHCQYCQNYQISGSHNNDLGIEVTEEQLGNIMVELQKIGATTINLVTGTHFIPSIVNSIIIAKTKGLTIPIVWNSSGYENVEALRKIDSFIDLYLVDIKTLNKTTASKFCGLSNYANAIIPVAKFLKRRHPQTDIENLKGTLVRHLVFPGEIDATLDFLYWFADNLKDCAQLSLMTQFVPPKENPGFVRMTDKEYDLLVNTMDSLKIDGFIQEREENEILWIPDFKKDQPFPENFATPLPYFLELKHKGHVIG